MSIKKSSIQQAILEAREIEKIATEKARKAIEEEMAPKIRQVANEALRELESKSLNEGMNLEIPDGAELTIKMPEDGTSEIETPEEETKIETPEEEITNEVPEEEETTNNEENMSDIFEIEGLNEEDAIQPDANAPVAPEAPVADVNATPPTDAAPTEVNTIDSVNQKLDDVLAKLDAIAGDSSAQGAEGDGEGDVSIIEDEPEAANAEAPVQAPEANPVQEEELMEYELDEDMESEGGMGEEVVYEVEDDGSMKEDMVEYELEEEDMSELNADSMMEMFNEIESLDEIELVDEDAEEEGEEPMEEIHGVGHNLKHSNRLAKLPRQGVDHRKEINESINKIKAQYGSKVDELNQENESLKQTIKEYKDSFIVLRKQINEVQIFNAKLAYANKLFTNGGLTNDEKMKIAEEFDSVETIEEAKKLYNNFLNEMKGSKSIKTPSVDKLKSVTPSVIKPSNAQTLYESDEMRRMKRLAGIGKRTEE
jgi:hypothetical protein